MPRTLDKNIAREHIKQFEYSRLFINHMGWDKPDVANVPIQYGDQTYTFKPIAKKRYLVVFECKCNHIPDRAVQKKLHAKLRKFSIENFIIFHTDNPDTQEWFFVWREPGHTIRAHIFKTNEDLIQRLQAITFSLEEEETLSPIEVLSKLKSSFDVERVTKRFYDKFKKEHTNLVKFIEGIPDDDMKSWYASVTLNRLMFVYFIQKKSFLNDDINYLKNQLERIKERKQESYYQEFLCPLFFDGFALEEKERTEEVNKLLGKVPYLNGGIFQKHQLEELYGEAIKIPDQVFDNLFTFFEEYRWHLDDRPTGEENEINPDVLGYIFEKYINQKQMGAYYTKEDITGYISRNTIIPWLFDNTKRLCRIAFEGENSVWQMLIEEPDRYFYPSVVKGCELPLPEKIAEGIENVGKRPDWNNLTDEAYALPTEIWRETVARRQRYAEIRLKIIDGEIKDINDFITYNLDIELFAQDMIQNAEGPELIRAFWKSLTTIKILDPTVGSGAFLFAAMNILERLYEDCLEQMQHFVNTLSEKDHPEKFSDFKKILLEIQDHASRPYFVYKSITLNNLYGVDIMEEAIETCKLRLFLKLMAQIEIKKDLEPLPDIDFNIRTGNSLIGFTSIHDAAKALKKSKTFYDGDQSATQEPLLALPEEENQAKRIEEDAQLVSQAYKRFQQMQTKQGMNAEDFRDAKNDIKEKLKNLNDELNKAQALNYGIFPKSPREYKEWLNSHQPFNWCIDFYKIITDGGFNVVIGNPPYISILKTSHNYTLKGYKCNDSPDIYAFCIERSVNLINENSKFGMILPISFVFSSDFSKIRSLCRNKFKNIWVSTFSRNPSALFYAGLGVRNTITIGSVEGHHGDNKIFTTRLIRWIEKSRPILFQTLEYTKTPTNLLNECWPRLDNEGIANMFSSLVNKSHGLRTQKQSSSYNLRFKTTALYYISAFIEDPPSYNKKGEKIVQTKIGNLFFKNEEELELAMVIILGKVSLLWWAATGDDFDVTASTLSSVPISIENFSDEEKVALLNISKKIKQSLSNNIIYTKYAGKWMGNYDIKYIRETTDISDKLILKSTDLLNHWDDIELAYYHFLKATGERPGTIRKKPKF